MPMSRISYTAFQEAKPSGLMLVPEEFVDEVADVILNDVEESDARDSNISRFKLVVKLDYKILSLDCKFT